jgi:ATP-binding cassette subfamily F protein uup
VALAQALVMRPDVLLLDEPTNHLDLDSIEWLENLLIDFKGSVVTITHDRSLPGPRGHPHRRTRSRCTALLPRQLHAVPGLKEEQLAQEAVINAKADKLLAQEEVWIRQGVEARRTRAQSAHQSAGCTCVHPPGQARREARWAASRMDVNDRRRPSGKIVAELTDVDKIRREAHRARTSASTMLRGDKIGLLGPNGAGKTTLLKLILGEADCTRLHRGKVRAGLQPPGGLL